MSVTGHLEILLHDLRYAARGLSRAPAFACAAIVAMALGIGASTAVFSVVDRILFRSLPYAEDGRLVSLGMVAPIASEEFLLAYDFLDWRDRQTPFRAMAYWAGAGDCDLTDARPVRVHCADVSAALLPVLGVQPLLGRNFAPADSRPHAPRVVLIGYGLWRSRFAADPRVVGRPNSLDGESATVAGVLPPRFEMPTLAPADVLVPHTMDEAEQRARKGTTLLRAIARLKPGVTVAQAAAALGPLFQESLAFVPAAFRRDVKLRVRSLRDRQIQDARLASWILLAAVLAVLLIACANVANLLLARAAARQRELALRAALGARRGRLVRQTLTESILLATAGGAAGCALSFALLRLFVAMAPEGIPRLSQAGVDGRMLAFALLVSSAAGLLSGLAPALQNPRAESLAGWRALTARHHLFRHTLVAAQFAISLVLLAGASLLLRSLWSLADQPLGIRTRHVITATVTLGRKSYSESARRQAFFAELEARLRRIPGIEEVAVSDSLPPTGDTTHSMLYAAIDVAGRARSTDGTGGPVAWRYVTPRYFAALGIPILRGRAFVEDDRDPNRNVVILSDLLARRMFPGQDPLAQQIRPGRAGPWLSVIGVAANVKNSGPMDRDDPEYYLVRKFSADNLGPGATAILRSELEPRLLAGWVRGQIAALDPALPVTIETMQQRAGRLTARARFNALLLTIFAGVGLLLAAIGLYGVSSFLVAQRTGEIGVRVALGATSGAIAGLVLQQAACSTAAGALLGVAGSLFALRLLQAMLFHVSARDPLTLAAAVAVLSGSALLAAWVPSRRAARIDPMQALRRE
ncbi:MAG: ABC transporter permease [Acidobacteriia bacterium]|nr:ABC transporter permease [Terriglobia bacterium]